MILWGAGSGFGIAVGPLVGGLIVSGLGWRWAFGLSAVAAVGLAAATLAIVPRAPARTLIVSGLLCAAAGALLLSRVGATLWPALPALGVAVLGSIVAAHAAAGTAAAYADGLSIALLVAATALLATAAVALKLVPA